MARSSTQLLGDYRNDLKKYFGQLRRNSSVLDRTFPDYHLLPKSCHAYARIVFDEELKLHEKELGYPDGRFK